MNLLDASIARMNQERGVPHESPESPEEEYPRIRDWTEREGLPRPRRTYTLEA